MTTGDNMGRAKETYGGFTSLVKWGAAVSAIVALIVIFLIAS